jgi:hypothetical protein
MLMKRAIVAAALTCVAAVVFAQTPPPPDVGAQARAAQRAVVGRILDVQAQFQTNRFGDQLIVSNVLLEVSETLKGASAPLLRLAVEGGTVGDLTLRVSDMPAVQSGDRGVFFLDDDGSGMHVPHGRGHGILKLTEAGRVEGTTLTLDDIRQQVRAALGQGAR